MIYRSRSGALHEAPGFFIRRLTDQIESGRIDSKPNRLSSGFGLKFSPHLALPSSKKGERERENSAKFSTIEGERSP